jgi:riboflavin kinase/FMN adenylyltransferase
VTKLIRGLHNISPQDQGAVLAIGNFDGVHRGHQALLKLLQQRAQSLHTSAMVMIFEPQPLEYYLADKLSVARISSLRDKYLALKSCQVDQVMLAYFNHSFAQLRPDDFVTEVLVKALRIKHIMVGDDFRFGHKRSGDVQQLQALATKYGFGVEIIPTILIDNERISSTLLRQALTSNAPALVRQYLGQAYTMSGRIAVGQQLGRQWGFPTANLVMKRMLTPIAGVYTVLVHGLSTTAWPGVANIGTRPTIAGNKVILEVHLLDFAQDIYGKQVTVEFCCKLREEIKFVDVAELRKQIVADVAAARAYFTAANEN